MATLSSRIHDLTTAVVTALNARASQAPASGYDIAKLNGYSGTQAQWLADFSDPGNTDYATQFNTQLGSIPTAGIATEGQVGTTQLASAAETFAGTIATKAVSPLRLAGMNVATSFADLASKVALPKGSLVGLNQLTVGSGTLYRSIWILDNTAFVPVTPLIVSSAAILPTIVTQVAAAGSGIGLDTGVTEAVVGSGSLPFRVPYLYNNGTFYVRPDPRMSATGYANAQQAITASNLNAIQTQIIVSDPTGLMAPASASPANWNAPWVGRYRFSMALAISQSVAAGSYSGITVYQTVNSVQTSVGDNGYRVAWQAGDVMRFSSDFYNNTAGAIVQCFLYAQMSANGNTVNGGAWSSTDAKNVRVTLEYLGA